MHVCCQKVLAARQPHFLAIVTISCGDAVLPVRPLATQSSKARDEGAMRKYRHDG